VQVFREGLRTSVPVLVRALEWAVQLRPDVINLSLAIDGGDTATIRRLCDRAVDAGIAVVAAARNGSGDGEPASYPSVIGVRAGSFRHCYHYGVLADQDIEFAGKGHWQVPGRRTCVSNSRAAAQMAGLIALLKSRHQDYKVAALRRMLIEYSMSTDAGSTTVH
jgi:subtilisin family serine protease